MSRLEPCPFCGSSAQIVEGIRGSYFVNYVKCDKCEAIGEKFGNKFSEKDKAIEAWNKRFTEENKLLSVGHICKKEDVHG